MQNDIGQTVPGPQGPAGGGAPTSLREFLRNKGEQFDLRERRRLRRDWLNSLDRLMNRVFDWLHESDPDGLLDIDRYQVGRAEPRLGIYEAPALKIRLGAAEVGLIPIGREMPPPAIRNDSIAHPVFQGRVDLTDGLVSPSRRYNLYREVRADEDRWHIRDERNRFSDLDRGEFERVLQDLLS